MDITDTGTSHDSIQFSLFRDTEQGLVVSASIIIKDDFRWKLIFHGVMMCYEPQQDSITLPQMLEGLCCHQSLSSTLHQ